MKKNTFFDIKVKFKSRSSPAPVSDMFTLPGINAVFITNDVILLFMVENSKTNLSRLSSESFNARWLTT